VCCVEFPKAAALLERRAKGDYSPYQHLPTLREYRPQRPSEPSEPKGAKGSLSDGRKCVSARQLFEAYARAAKLAPETIIRRRVVVTELDAHLDGRDFDALSDEEAQEWITSRVTDKRSAYTVQDQTNMTPTNTDLDYTPPSDTRELLLIGKELMQLDQNLLTEEDEDLLLVYSDIMMAFAKSAHQEGGHYAAMNSALDSYNALRRVMGMHDHVSTIVLTAD
jgi:hypothetical protein